MKTTAAQWIANLAGLSPEFFAFRCKKNYVQRKESMLKEVSCKLEAALWPNEWLVKKVSKETFEITVPLQLDEAQSLLKFQLLCAKSNTKSL